jgi:hypothetical protein
MEASAAISNVGAIPKMEAADKVSNGSFASFLL